MYTPTPPLSKQLQVWLNDRNCSCQKEKTLAKVMMTLVIIGSKK